jgi:hypothetical protein
MSAQVYPTTLLAKDSSDPYPSIDSIWNFFSSKGVKTVFVTLGCSSSALADLELAEILGCSLTAVAISKSDEQKWNEVSSIIKARERTEENSKFPFSEGAQEKWILPKNMRIKSTLPNWLKGSVELSTGESVHTEEAFTWVESLCKEIGVKNNDVRLDIVKMSLPYQLEQTFLYSLLTAGFRPALFIIQWSKMPNEDVATSLVAGHLQTIGYRLIQKIGTKFLYIYTDQDWYMTCSWEDITAPNPLIAEVLRQSQISRQKSGNDNARFQKGESSEPVPSSGEADAPL